MRDEDCYLVAACSRASNRANGIRLKSVVLCLRRKACWKEMGMNRRNGSSRWVYITTYHIAEVRELLYRTCNEINKYRPAIERGLGASRSRTTPPNASAQTLEGPKKHQRCMPNRRQPPAKRTPSMYKPMSKTLSKRSPHPQYDSSNPCRSTPPPPPSQTRSFLFAGTSGKMPAFRPFSQLHWTALSVFQVQ